MLLVVRAKLLGKLFLAIVRFKVRHNFENCFVKNGHLPIDVDIFKH